MLHMISALIVEDDPTIRQLMAVNLTARQFQVTQAENGIEGLKKLRESPPSVVLLDLRMPGMSGSEFLDAMSEDPLLSSIPVVVVTASLVDISETNVTKIPNVTQVLLKPLKVNELMEAIAEALNDYSPQA